MLACRSVLADLDDVPTLVFDEVDAGHRRRGRPRRRPAPRAARRDRQVLVVTHLPQIACFADRHVRVRKDDGIAAVEVLDERRAASGALPDARRAGDLGACPVARRGAARRGRAACATPVACESAKFRSAIADAVSAASATVGFPW